MIGWFVKAISFFWNGSFAKRILFSEMGLGVSFERGMFGRLCCFFTRPTQREKPIKAAVNSKAITAISAAFGSVLDTGTRAVSAFFIFFAVPVVVYVFLNDGGIMLYAGVACFMIGAVLFVFNRTPRGLYNGSFVCKLFGGLFVADKTTHSRVACPPKFVWLFYASLGLVFAILAIALDFDLFIMAAGGLMAFLVVMWKIEVGVFALAFILPLAPTAIVAPLCALVVFSFLVKTFITRSMAFKFRLMDFAVLLFVGMLLYGYVVSFNRAGSVFMVSMYLLFALTYFAVRNALRTKEMIFGVFATLAASGLFVALYGVYQQLTGNFNPAAAWLDETMFGGGGRIYSTLDNPNVLGQYLIFTILIALALVYVYRSYFHKTAAVGVFGVAMLCIVFTQSRGAWLGLLFAIAVFALLHDRRLVVLGIIALLFMPLILPEAVLMRFLSIGDTADGSTLFRVQIWQASILMVRDFWISGIGLGEGAFSRIYQMYAFNAVVSPHSHNLYLQILIDMGIAGITVFMLVLVCLYKNMLLSIKKMGRLAALPAALCAAMTGYLIQGMTDNAFYNYRIVAFFWICVALAASMNEMENRKNEETKDQKREECIEVG